MAARPANFKQADVKRAVAGAVAAGLTVGRVEIAKDGTIVIVAELPKCQPDMTGLERWRATRRARSS
jgi:hypothetical protein